MFFFKFFQGYNNFYDYGRHKLVTDGPRKGQEDYVLRGTRLRHQFYKLQAEGPLMESKIEGKEPESTRCCFWTLGRRMLLSHSSVR